MVGTCWMLLLPNKSYIIIALGKDILLIKISSKIILEFVFLILYFRSVKG